jgi:hypothetical protein
MRWRNIEAWSARLRELMGQTAKRGSVQEGSQEQAEAKWRQMAESVQAKLAAFWAGPQQHRQRLTAVILSLHLPLTQADLVEWADDPEAWFHANDGDLLATELRGIAEIVLRVRVAQLACTSSLSC